MKSELGGNRTPGLSHVIMLLMSCHRFPRNKAFLFRYSEVFWCEAFLACQLFLSLFGILRQNSFLPLFLQPLPSVTWLMSNHDRSNLACSRLSDGGEDAKVKGTRKVGGAKKRKRKGERACNHFFYDPLPPTFGTFEIIRFRLSNCWNVNELESFSNFSRDYFARR